MEHFRVNDTNESSESDFDPRLNGWRIKHRHWHFHKQLFQRYGVILEYGEFSELARDIRSGRAELMEKQPGRGAIFAALLMRSWKLQSPAWIPEVTTPRAIAERWRCSERHVRNLIKSGELPSFRVGMKLIRVRLSDLEAYECRNGVSPVCAENSASLGQTETFDAATGSEHLIHKRRPSAPRLELTRPRGSSVADLWEAYLIDMEGRAVATTMRYSWRALKSRFGDMEAEAITIADCRAHIAERRSAGIKDGTIHTELGHLRMVIKWAEKHGQISRAPQIERPSKPEPKEAFLTRQEASRLLEAAGAAHVRLAIQLLVGTGARGTAALELTWDRVDFGKGLIHLRNPLDKGRRKGRAVVPVNQSLRETLRVAKQGALSPFVVEWAGKSVKSIKRSLKRAGEAIGRPDVFPHMLRHSAAVWLAEDGHSMDEIAQFLGHGDSRITARVYARYSPTYLRKLAASLDLGVPKPVAPVVDAG